MGFGRKVEGIEAMVVTVVIVVGVAMAQLMKPIEALPYVSPPLTSKVARSQLLALTKYE